jgi:hypothetical protein
MSQALRVCFSLVLCLIAGAASAASAASPPRSGADLAKICAGEQDGCISFIGAIATASGDDKVICLPNGYTLDHLRQAYIEWAAASDPELLAREPADQAVLAAFKELYSCEE